MSLIDSILNLAALLLWFNWRSLRFDPLVRRKPATLAGTLKSTRPHTASSWVLLGSIPALLIVRAFLYWQIGSPADWTPKLDLGLVVLAFPIDEFLAALVFSVVSFIRLAAIAFLWFLAIVIITRRVAEPDLILKLARLQLGRVSRLPLWVQIILPAVLTLAVWAGVRPVIGMIGSVGAAHSSTQVIQQGCLLFLALVTSLKFLLPIILLLYMLSTYVYLGNNPLWDFVTNVSRAFLTPFGRMKLRSSKLDFAPLAGVVVIFLVLHTLPVLAIRFAEAHNLVLWPE